MLTPSRHVIPPLIYPGAVFVGMLTPSRHVISLLLYPGAVFVQVFAFHMSFMIGHCSLFMFSVLYSVASHKVQRFDGWYNNLAYPSWGSAGTFI
jgi:hypothetical protein